MGTRRRVRRALGVLALALAAPVSCSEAGSPASGSPAVEPSLHPTVAFRERTSQRLPPDYANPYAFSDDWFSERIPEWRELFAAQVGRPGLHYLEIGVYEGRSFLWMLDHVLTDPTSRLTAVDIFSSARVKQRFLGNVELSGQSHRVETLEGPSRRVLRQLPLESFDIVYIDGSHAADDVLADAVLSFDLLRADGLLVFDDYLWNGSYYTGSGGSLPPELLPGPAIDAFLDTHRNYVEVVRRGYQVVLRKRRNPCPNKTTCSPLGPYSYDWQTRQLRRGPERAPVTLSEPERHSLEELLRSRAPGPGASELLGRLGVAPDLL